MTLSHPKPEPPPPRIQPRQTLHRFSSSRVLSCWNSQAGAPAKHYPTTRPLRSKHKPDHLPAGDPETCGGTWKPMKILKAVAFLAVMLIAVNLGCPETRTPPEAL